MTIHPNNYPKYGIKEIDGTTHIRTTRTMRVSEMTVEELIADIRETSKDMVQTECDITGYEYEMDLEIRGYVPADLKGIEASIAAQDATRRANDERILNRIRLSSPELFQ